MNLLLVIVILHYAIHFGHCTVVIDFDETTQTENMVNLNVNLTVPMTEISYCIQPYGTIHCFHYYCLLRINKERRKTS